MPARPTSASRARPWAARWTGALLLPLYLSWGSHARAIEVIQFLELYDEVVCWVGTESISKRDIEQRMYGQGQAMISLFLLRDRLKADSQWTEESQKKFNEIYVPSFLEELRKLIRERLMLQTAKAESISVDKIMFEKIYRAKVEELRKQGMLGEKGFSLQEVREKMGERMLIEEFRRSLMSILDIPNKPDIEEYYRAHLSEYQRKAGVKIRQIRIDRYKEEFGKLRAREADKLIEELYKKVKEDGESFSDMAKQFSDDDEETRKRGGLILGREGDPYLDLEQYTRYARLVRGLKPGEMSSIFELGEKSLAFLVLEDRREAGPRPLDAALFEEISGTLTRKRHEKREDEWFRKVLQTSLVLDGLEKPLPAKFFFPDDPPPPEKK